MQTTSEAFFSRPTDPIHYLNTCLSSALKNAPLHTVQSVQKCLAYLQKEYTDLHSTITSQESTILGLEQEKASLLAELDHEKQQRRSTEKQLRERISILEHRIRGIRSNNPVFRKIDTEHQAQTDQLEAIHKDLVQNFNVFIKVQDEKAKSTQNCLNALAESRVSQAELRVGELLKAKDNHYEKLYSSKPWSEIRELRGNVAQLEEFNRKLLEENAGLRARIREVRIDPKGVPETQPKSAKNVNKATQAGRELKTAQASARRSSSTKRVCVKKPGLLNALALLARTRYGKFKEI